MPPPKEIILGCVLALLVCLGLGPLLAANSNPTKYVHSNLKVFVVDYESTDAFVCGQDDASDFPGENFGCGRYLSTHGLVGIKLKLFLEMVASHDAHLPSFEYKSVLDYPTPASLETAVRDRDAWAAIWINEGTSKGIAGALKSPSDSSWNPKSAIGFAWDEARNNAVAASRVGGTVRGLLTAFGPYIGAQVQVEFRNTLTQDGNELDRLDDFLLSSDHTSLLTQPVSFTEFNLAPFDVPIMSQAQTIGNIIMTGESALQCVRSPS